MISYLLAAMVAGAVTALVAWLWPAHEHDWKATAAHSHAGRTAVSMPETDIRWRCRRCPEVRSTVLAGAWRLPELSLWQPAPSTVATGAFRAVPDSQFRPRHAAGCAR